MNINATLVIQFLSFLVLLWLLSKYFYAPLSEFLDKRAKQVKGIIDEAKSDQQQARENLDLSKQRLDKVRDDILQLKKEADLQADHHRRSIIEEAKKEAEHIVSRSKEEIEKQAREASEEIRKQVGSISVDIARKIIQKELNHKDHEKIIHESIDRLKKE
jgi:F-type H+-transporting ATPase subunit b